MSNELSLAEVRQWIHDMRNSMYALQMGVELLPQVRNDDQNFDRVQRMMSDELRKAAALVEEFSKAAPRQIPQKSV